MIHTQFLEVLYVMPGGMSQIDMYIKAVIVIIFSNESSLFMRVTIIIK